MTHNLKTEHAPETATLVHLHRFIDASHDLEELRALEP